MAALNGTPFLALRRIAGACAGTILLLGTTAPSLAGQTHFGSPEAAIEALVAGLKNDSIAELTVVLGADADRLLASGDAVADKQARAAFLASFDESHRITLSGDARAVLEIGKDGWPLPVPIVRGPQGWYFDTAAGEDEMVNRRIGRNELSTIQMMLTYVDAQREYASEDRDGSGARSYAMKLRSTPGNRDGLYWPTTEGEAQSPLGPLFADAAKEGYPGHDAATTTPTAYHGYYYRILTGQGADAPGGAYEYVAGGRMIGGFALLAYPASYRVSGIMSFIVGPDGIVYEQDLGPDTAGIAAGVTTYNPDRSWRRVESPG